mmetsp:Transcript_10240/g.14696  ORF Transcript_10240/g.14696 Transcript_10240/m.14696 type:complete len:107 (-) Transcript_10240:34-354(-)
MCPYFCTSHGSGGCDRHGSRDLLSAVERFRGSSSPSKEEIVVSEDFVSSATAPSSGTSQSYTLMMYRRQAETAAETELAVADNDVVLTSTEAATEQKNDTSPSKGS